MRPVSDHGDRPFFRLLRPVVMSVLCLAPAGASAQGFEVLGTRALGMAGAFVAVADDATAIYWNPAGLARGPLFDLVLERQQGDVLLEGRNRPVDSSTLGTGLGSFALAMGTPPLGLSYYRIRATSVSGPLALSLPNGSGDQGAGDRQDVGSGGAAVRTLLTQHFGATLVQSLTSAVTFGTTLKIVHGTAASGLVVGGTGEAALDAAAGFEGKSRTRVDLDAGVLATLGAWRIGVVGRNLRQPEFDSSTDGLVPADSVRLSRQVRAGLAFAPRSRAAGTNGPMTFAADLDLERVDTVLGPRRELAIGGEGWWFGGRVGARAGVRLNTLDPRGFDRDPVPAVGFSVSPKRGVLVEGQITRGQNQLEQAWGVSLRVTF